MEHKQQVITIGLLALIVGLLIGYFFGTSAMPHREFLSDESMREEMEEHMAGDDFLEGDGEMQHMMDEMLLIGRGQTGAAYEEAWLRGMVVHHLGAVEMSKELLRQTDRPELVGLAEHIIESQSAEVDQMRAWLRTWFTENGA